MILMMPFPIRWAGNTGIEEARHHSVRPVGGAFADFPRVLIRILLLMTLPIPKYELLEEEKQWAQAR